MCFSSKHAEQVPVGSGQTFTYECELAVHKPGPFVATMEIHLEDNGVRTVELIVRGVGVVPGGTADELPNR